MTAEMSPEGHLLSFDRLSPEARRAAERAADVAGMPLEDWLNQLIKYVSAMEFSGRATLAPPPPPAETEDRGNSAGAAAIEVTDDPVPETAPLAVLSPSGLDTGAVPDEERIQKTAEAWKRGATEPIIVRRRAGEENAYEVVAGTEHYEAAKRLELEEVPVVVKDLSNEEALKVALVHELMREDLLPLREAEIYRRLMRHSSLSAEELAVSLGRPPAQVAATARLVDLPASVRDLLESGELTVLHARALVDAEDPEAAAREVVTRRLDIYQTEQLVRGTAPGAEPNPAVAEAGPRGVTETQLLERHLSRLLGLKVSINQSNEVGVVAIHYAGHDELSDLISRLDEAGKG